MGTIRICPGITLEEDELRFSFVHSSGPGGQNVNKVATCAQLRFDAAASPSLTDPVRERLLKLAGSKATVAGEILIEAKRYRSQGQNRDDAVERLTKLILQAATPPRRRRKTLPTAGSRQRRLTAKKQRSQTKRLRGDPGDA